MVPDPRGDCDLSVGPHFRLQKVRPACFLLHRPQLIRIFPEVSHVANFISVNCQGSQWGMPESHLDFSVLSCVPREPRRKSVQLSLTFRANCSQASPVSPSPTIPRTHLRSHQTLLSFIHPLTHSASMLLHPRSEPRNMLKTRQPVWIKHSALFVSTLLSPLWIICPDSVRWQIHPHPSWLVNPTDGELLHPPVGLCPQH